MKSFLKNIYKAMKYIFLKINIFRFFVYKIKYGLNTGNYVHLHFLGNFLIDQSVSIRDFSEIIIFENGKLELKEKVFIGQSVEIGAQSIFIDRNTSIQNRCILLGNIQIGKNCLLGPSIYISSGQHHFDFRPELLIRDQDRLFISQQKETKQFITIEDDVWIGKNVVIINGVTIGKGAIVGANSLVNKDILPYTVVGGNPCVELRKRLNFHENIPCELWGNKAEFFPYFYKGVDYSLKSMELYKYVIIEDIEIKLYLRNQFKMSSIVLVLDADIEGQKICYDEVTKVLEEGQNTIQFKIKSFKDIEYLFKVDNICNKIKILKVYFDV